jgi:hypothetical protein
MLPVFTTFRKLWPNSTWSCANQGQPIGHTGGQLRLGHEAAGAGVVVPHLR